jgi:hypothetical protein
MARDSLGLFTQNEGKGLNLIARNSTEQADILEDFEAIGPFRAKSAFTEFPAQSTRGSIYISMGIRNR